MKKKILITAIILTGALSGWVYFANKFEKIAQDQIIPKLQTLSPTITYNEESIKIDKYKFKIHLEDIKITSPEDIIAISTDKITITANPFSKNISLSTKGEKISIGHTIIQANESFIYIKQPNISLNFSKNLLEKGINNFEISLDGKNLEIFDTKNDKLLGSNEKIEYNLSCKKHKDTNNYILNLLTNDIEMRLTPYYFEYVSNNTILPGASEEKQIAFSNYMKAFLELFYSKEYAPIKMSSDTELLISENFLAALQESITDIQVFNKYLTLNTDFLKKDILNLKTNITYQDKLSSHKVATSFVYNADKNKFITNIDLDNNNSYGENREKEKLVLHHWANVIFSVVKLLDNNNALILEDYLPIAGLITSIDQSNFNLNLEYASMADINYKIKSGINHKNILLNGSLQGHDNQLEIQVEAPQILLENIANITNIITDTIKKDSRFADIVEVNKARKIAEFLKSNSKEITELFHHKEELKTDENLLINLVVDQQNPTQVIINDQNTEEFMKNEKMIIIALRLQKLIQDVE